MKKTESIHRPRGAVAALILAGALLLPRFSSPAAEPPAAKSAPGDIPLLQSPGAAGNRAPSDYGLGDSHVSKLKPYPPGGPGSRTPFDLWNYAGRGESSWKAPVLPMSWDEWLDKMTKQKPVLMAECNAYMAARFDFSGKAIPGATMSGGKAIMAGPVARLPKGVASWEALAALNPVDVRARGVFPFLPLAHPLQTTAHMLFPYQWTRVHPEHERIDVDFDIPDE